VVVSIDQAPGVMRSARPGLNTPCEISAKPIRVASVPAGHVYVRHLSDPDRDDGVVRLPDPVPSDGALVPWGWWPPQMLDARWILDHRDSFDVFHVHFGFDGKTVEELLDVGSALDAIGVPLVFTLHDLRNPHHRDRAMHDAQLDVLVGHAAALVTLTPGAAQAIGTRWKRAAEVLPHPHVVGHARLASMRPSHDSFIVGLHAKSLRANMDVLGVAAVLRDALADLPDAYLRIDLHDEVSDPESYWYDPEAASRLRELAESTTHVELHEHRYFSDDELWDYLRSLDVSVLPYRFGTHSGWLEACYDLGTTVVAPTCGFYAQQRPCLSYVHDQRGLDDASLTKAIRRTYRLRPSWRANRAERIRERRALAHAHRSVYERLLT
jgi:hypothetical protein